ncbi:hypothetical protein OE88DRAFT_653116 [Heliocybe sulcata]|uniref:Uncharacterized protein n=1 Tax=Heliocybe sulcata TaxID=5364 RepID=A0A5C3NCZ9_9AGAM|nr:hypothetical protein OE88DRAFT_653116 [Heliocybe sulcata]
MDLFRSRPTQSFATAAVAAFAAHLILWLMPSNLHVFTLMQTAVATLALSGLMVLVVMHHRRSGGLLTHAQEETILIGAFGLFWLGTLHSSSESQNHYESLRVTRKLSSSPSELRPRIPRWAPNLVRQASHLHKHRQFGRSLEVSTEIGLTGILPALLQVVDHGLAGGTMRYVSWRNITGSGCIKFFDSEEHGCCWWNGDEDTLSDRISRLCW